MNGQRLGFVLAGGAGALVAAYFLLFTDARRPGPPPQRLEARPVGLLPPALPAAQSLAQAGADRQPPLDVASAIAITAATNDVSALARQVQSAISSPQLGDAGKAAQAIQGCLTRERSQGALQQFADKHPEKLRGDMLARMMEADAAMLRQCQALDAHSRAQLIPLLRQSVAEGDQGAPIRLVVALGKGFDAAAEPAAVDGTRRDAQACHRRTLESLRMMARVIPGLATASEAAAYAKVLHSFPVKANARSSNNKFEEFLDSVKLPFGPTGTVDADEVERLYNLIKARC